MIAKQIQEAVEYINAVKATGSLNPYKEVVQMSIEQSLERIAVALESLTANAPTVATEAPKEKKAKKETAAVPAEDILADAPVYTQDEVLKSLRVYMDKNGGEKTKALMIKHGADKVTPKITTIPVDSYVALMKELGA